MAKISVILANLGSPKAPTTKEVSKYLKQFLTDPRVVDASQPLWSLILSFIRFKRSPKVAKVYEEVWTAEGAPLIVTSLQQGAKLEALLKEKYPEHEFSVTVGMSYADPDLERITKESFATKPDKVVLLPLYPQFSSSTTLSVVDAFNRAYADKNQRFVPPYHIIFEYHQHAAYIKALAESVKDFVREQDRSLTPAQYFTAERKLFVSYHGIPCRYADLGDPYPEQCEGTTSALVAALGLSPESYLLTYQSVFGREPWLTPATDNSLIEHAKAYGKQGEAVIICPGFSTDCIETLEENGIGNRELYTENGGGSYHLISCLNDSNAHIEMMHQVIKPYLAL